MCTQFQESGGVQKGSGASSENLNNQNSFYFNFAAFTFGHAPFCGSFRRAVAPALYYFINNSGRISWLDTDELLPLKIAGVLSVAHVTSVLWRSKLNHRPSNAAVNPARQFLSDWISLRWISPLKSRRQICWNSLNRWKNNAWKLNRFRKLFVTLASVLSNYY